MSEDRPEPADEIRVWRLRAVEGEGWLRELTADGPIITADRDEAEQFASAGDARSALERYSKIRGRVAGLRRSPVQPTLRTWATTRWRGPSRRSHRAHTPWSCPATARWRFGTP